MRQFHERLILCTFFVCSLIAAVSAVPVYPGNLTAHFINVGQGDAIFLVSPGNDTVLIDAGCNVSMGARVVDYIRSTGFDLDIIITTHSDFDHIGGIPTVLGNFTPRVFIDSPYPTMPWTGTYTTMRNRINQTNISYQAIKAGEYDLVYQGMHLSVLNPQPEPFPDTNNNSLVLQVGHGTVEFLLMGDAGETAEQAIMQNFSTLEADILKVGHHGSASATSPAFLARVHPGIAVIEVEAGNSYGHPAPSTLENLRSAGATVYRTDLNGTIVVTTDGTSYFVSTEVQSIRSIPGYDGLPTDPDGDGLYEDLNGNGRKDFADVVILFRDMAWISGNEPVNVMDFNGNGRIDFDDVVKLFRETR